MKRSSLLAAFASLSLSLFSTFAQAQPIRSAFIPNFHRVNDRLYRGGQPADQAWAALAGMGVKTVVDFRHDREHAVDAEAKAVEAAGMRYINIPIHGLNTPTPDQLAKMLEVMDVGDTVFVHCAKGCDRTGTMVAVYRMEREGWDGAKALNEAEDCGIHWYSRAMKQFIRDYKPTQAVSAAKQ